jgi:hypothetical protein
MWENCFALVHLVYRILKCASEFRDKFAYQKMYKVTLLWEFIMSLPVCACISYFKQPSGFKLNFIRVAQAVHNILSIQPLLGEQEQVTIFME